MNKEILDYIKKATLKDDYLVVLFIDDDEQNIKLIKKVFQELNIFSFQRLKEFELKNFIQYHFKRLDKNISNSDALHLVSRSGYLHRDSTVTLQDILNHINVIASYSREDNISREDIEKNIDQSTDTHVFTFINNIFRDKKNAYKILEEMFLEGEPEYKILGKIIFNLELTLKVFQLKNKGYSNGDIAKLLGGIHEFRVKIFLSLSRNLKEEQIKKGLLHAYEVDENIKFGILSGKLAIEIFMAKLFLDFK